MKHIKNIFYIGFVCTTVMFSGFSVSYAEESTIIRTEQKVIKIEVGEGLMLQVKKPISAIVTPDEGKIIDVQLPSPNSKNIFILGISKGTTSLFVMDNNGDLIVRKDVKVSTNEVIHICGITGGGYKQNNVFTEQSKTKTGAQSCGDNQNTSKNTNNTGNKQ